MAGEIPNPLDSYNIGYKAGFMAQHHQLLFPPHPGDYYLCSALCTCGDYQYDCDTPNDVLLDQVIIRRDWFNNHLSKVA